MALVRDGMFYAIGMRGEVVVPRMAESSVQRRSGGSSGGDDGGSHSHRRHSEYDVDRASKAAKKSSRKEQRKERKERKERRRRASVDSPYGAMGQTQPPPPQAATPEELN